MYQVLITTWIINNINSSHGVAMTSSLRTDIVEFTSRATADSVVNKLNNSGTNVIGRTAVALYT